MIQLSITITNGWIIIIVILSITLIASYLKKDKQNQTLESDAKLAKSEAEKKFAELKVTYQDWALSELEKFKNNEIKSIERNAEQNSIKAATNLLEKWKVENEAKIRQDAINRSYSVNLGKITEHLLPYHESFLSQFNPKDARFIGSPIDLIVFDGYADKKEELFIYLIEIKTGNSKLTEIQKRIKASVLAGNIRWAEINPKDYTSKKEAENDSEVQELLLDIIISISKINNINDTHEFVNKITKHVKAAINLVFDEGWTPNDAIEHELNKLCLIFNSIKEKTEFIKIWKDTIKNCC